MPYRPLDRETYDKLLESFRNYPGEIDRAAKFSGVDWRTAKRAWAGPPRKKLAWFRVIKDVLADEKAEAERLRAQQDAALTAERERIAKEAEDARRLEEEARMVDEASLRTLRKDALAGLVACAALTDGIGKLAKRIGDQLSTGVDKNGKPLDIEVGSTLKILRDYSLTVGRLGHIVDTIASMQRVKEGLPTAVMGINVAHITLEDAEREVEFAKGALERARELGLVVHSGGAEAKKPA
jgi:hypothetical protein